MTVVMKQSEDEMEFGYMMNSHHIGYQNQDNREDAHYHHTHHHHTTSSQSVFRPSLLSSRTPRSTSSYPITTTFDQQSQIRSSRYSKSLSLQDCDSFVLKWLSLQGFDPRDCQKAKLFDVYNRHLSPMARAAEYGQLKVCQELFKTSASMDVGSADVKGFTPMIYAAMNGHIRVCQWLFYSAGASADVADHHSQTPLHWACATGKLELVQWLFSVLPPKFDSLDAIAILSSSSSSSSSPNPSSEESQTKQDYRTILRPTKALQRPLYLACANGHVDVARFLITQGALHTPKNESGAHDEPLVWKLDKKVVLKDISATLAEPYLYRWCAGLINSNASFFLFLMACKVPGHEVSASSSSSSSARSFSSSPSSFSSSFDSHISTTTATRSSKRQCFQHHKINKTNEKGGNKQGDSLYDGHRVASPCCLLKLKHLDPSCFQIIVKYAGIPQGAALKDFKELLNCLQFD